MSIDMKERLKNILSYAFENAHTRISSKNRVYIVTILKKIVVAGWSKIFYNFYTQYILLNMV